MDNTSDNIEKKYFTIGEVAQKLGVSSSLIRFYEKEFSMLNPRKSKGGTRKYNLADLHLLQRIIQLVKTEGFTIAGAKEKLKSNAPSADAAEEIKLKLNNLKTFLLELKTNLS
jgi:DNA-binding transcriptional MerR regulator